MSSVCRYAGRFFWLLPEQEIFHNLILQEYIESPNILSKGRRSKFKHKKISYISDKKKNINRKPN